MYLYITYESYVFIQNFTFYLKWAISYRCQALNSLYISHGGHVGVLPLNWSGIFFTFSWIYPNLWEYFVCDKIDLEILTDLRALNGFGMYEYVCMYIFIFIYMCALLALEPLDEFDLYLVFKSFF
jgi:hypothetical protein